MNRWIQAAVGLAVLAMIGVLISETRTAAVNDAWSALALARLDEDPIPALESAREAADGTSAEPWASFELAMMLYDDGGAEERQRAEQVAQATITEHPDHAVAPLLQKLLTALNTYES